MPILAVEFETWVDNSGYEWKRGGRMLGGGILRPKGGPLVRKRPLEFHETLYKQFADTLDTPEGWVEFVTAFGPVTYMHDPVRGHEPHEEWGEIDFENTGRLRGLQIEMQDLIEDWAKGSRASIARIEEDFGASLRVGLRRRGQRGDIGLAFAPTTLWDAMMIQFGQAVASGRALRSCEMCGTFFEVGTAAKRTTARFCSDRCRMQFHNTQRAKGATG